MFDISIKLSASVMLNDLWITKFDKYVTQVFCNLHCWFLIGWGQTNRLKTSVFALFIVERNSLDILTTSTCYVSCTELLIICFNGTLLLNLITRFRYSGSVNNSFFTSLSPLLSLMIVEFFALHLYLLLFPQKSFVLEETL